MEKELTLALVVDSRGMEQLSHTIPTWRMHRPELWDLQWLVVFDPQQVRQLDVELLLHHAGHAEQMERRPCIVAWQPSTSYETQRERMLTAFVTHVPMFVRTRWWLKLDTDAFATRGGEWVTEELLRPVNEQHPAYVASSWGYTKAKGGGGDGAQWAEKLEVFGDTLTDQSRLGLREHVDGKRITVRRMASWVSLYKTTWTLWLRDMCEQHCGRDKLPVPSQDTVAWYAAARTRHHAVAKRLWAKRAGWGNTPSTDKLARRCRELLQCGDAGTGPAHTLNAST